jgi:hypothetical protein
VPSSHCRQSSGRQRAGRRINCFASPKTRREVPQPHEKPTAPARSHRPRQAGQPFRSSSASSQTKTDNIVRASTKSPARPGRPGTGHGRGHGHGGGA